MMYTNITQLCIGRCVRIMQVHFINSTRGHPQLLLNGQLFNNYGINKTVTPFRLYWRCIIAKLDGIKCEAKVHTENGIIVYANENYKNHTAEADVIKKKIIMNKMKEKAVANVHENP